MHPLRGTAISLCTTLFLIGAIGWMLPVSTNVGGSSVSCGSILQPASAPSIQSDLLDRQCGDSRELRGLLGALGMGAGIVGLGLAIGVESARPQPAPPRLRLITNRDIENNPEHYRSQRLRRLDDNSSGGLVVQKGD